MKAKQKNTEVKTKSLLPTLPKTAILSLEVELLDRISHVISKEMANVLY
jgi:hypothetical protein